VAPGNDLSSLVEFFKQRESAMEARFNAKLEAVKADFRVENRRVCQRIADLSLQLHDVRKDCQKIDHALLQQFFLNEKFDALQAEIIADYTKLDALEANVLRLQTDVANIGNVPAPAIWHWPIEEKKVEEPKETASSPCGHRGKMVELTDRVINLEQTFATMALNKQQAEVPHKRRHGEDPMPFKIASILEHKEFSSSSTSAFAPINFQPIRERIASSTSDSDLKVEVNDSSSSDYELCGGSPASSDSGANTDSTQRSASSNSFELV
jgi:hypothetical protein